MADSTTVAIVQESPAVLDLPAGLAKAADGIARAAAQGARLVVFPETWLTCYPAWVFGLAGWQDPVAKDWYARLLDNSPVLGRPDDPDDDLAPVRAAARESGTTVVLGMNERAAAGSGTVYNSSVTIGPDGTLQNVHRKLTPTHTERIVWGAGDASGLRVVETPAGRVGSLVCWEHWNPLARHALHAQQEQVHVSLWPDLPEMHLIASRSYAFEGSCHVLCAAQYLHADDVPGELLDAYLRGVGPDAAPGEILFDGGSCVIGPSGELVTDQLTGREGIVLAVIDGADRSREQHSHDTVGHYSRPDVFSLTVDRRRHAPVELVDDEGRGTAW